MELEEIKRRMHDGRIYFCNDKDLLKEQMLRLNMLYDFNNTRPLEQDKRMKLLKEMFAEIGEDCYVEPPLHASWAGKFVHFGKGVFANFNLTLVDDTEIYVGDNVLIGPNVTLCAGTHPISPKLRKKSAQYNKAIHIGNNVWLGGNVFVMPGVTIGDNSIIGASSIVTKDIPANVIAVGNPCRVLRSITEKDEQIYDKDKKIDVE